MATPTIPLTDEILAAIKTDHADKAIYKTEINKQTYVFTLLTRPDHVKIQAWMAKNPNAKMSAYDKQVVQGRILFPQIDERFENTLPAGIYTTLADLIREKSLLFTPGTDVSRLYTVDVIQEAVESDPPTEEEIANLRNVTTQPMHLITIGGVSLVVRPILRQEWVQIQSAPEDADTDVLVASRCTLWPKPVDFSGAAGIPSVAARHIMLFSGFSDSPEVEEL